MLTTSTLSLLSWQIDSFIERNLRVYLLRTKYNILYILYYIIYTITEKYYLQLLPVLAAVVSSAAEVEPAVDMASIVSPVAVWRDVVIIPELEDTKETVELSTAVESGPEEADVVSMTVVLGCVEIVCPPVLLGCKVVKESWLFVEVPCWMEIYSVVMSFEIDVVE